MWHQKITPPSSSKGLSTTLGEAKHFQQGCQTYGSRARTSQPEGPIRPVCQIPNVKNVDVPLKFSLVFSSPVVVDLQSGAKTRDGVKKYNKQ